MAKKVSAYEKYDAGYSTDLSPGKKAYHRNMSNRHRVDGKLDVDSLVSEMERRERTNIRDRKIIKKARSKE